MAHGQLCYFPNRFTSNSTATDIKDCPLQVVLCRDHSCCSDNEDSRPVQAYDTLVRCENRDAGQYEIGLRVIDMGTAFTGTGGKSNLELIRFHILVGIILEMPASITPVAGQEILELHPLKSPTEYACLQLRKDAILHVALIPSFNLDTLDAFYRYRRHNTYAQPEFNTACTWLTQYSRAFTELYLLEPQERNDHWVANVEEDVLQDVKRRMQLFDGRTDVRLHGFLCNATRPRSDGFHVGWLSYDQSFCWIDANIYKPGCWNIWEAVMITYNALDNGQPHTIDIKACSTDILIKHPISAVVSAGKTMACRADNRVRIRIPSGKTIEFRIYTPPSGFAGKRLR